MFDQSAGVIICLIDASLRHKCLAIDTPPLEKTAREELDVRLRGATPEKLLMLIKAILTCSDGPEYIQIIYVYIYIYICIYVYMCIYTCISIITCLHIHIHIQYICTYPYTCTQGPASPALSWAPQQPPCRLAAAGAPSVRVSIGVI